MLRAHIGKGSDQYLPEFFTPDEIERFGKELDDYRSDLFRKEYLPKVRPFPKVPELLQRIRDDNKRIMLASSGKKADTKYYIDLLKIDNLIDGYVSGDDADKHREAIHKIETPNCSNACVERTTATQRLRKLLKRPPKR
jgi:phosphoglycolate phosphatase-like HAD superfamily hydrolase